MKQIINDGKNDDRPPFYFLPDEDDYFYLLKIRYRSRFYYEDLPEYHDANDAQKDLRPPQGQNVPAVSWV